ncbi:MAG: SusD/RagB family nutrient-binding outer membrane lipoprotein [Bacteroidota bacterium]
MKNIKAYIILIAVTTLSGCSDYLDINRDPSLPQEATAQVLLPPMFQEMVAGEAFDSRFIGKYVQNWSQVTAGDIWDAHGYNSGSDNGGQMWRSHYWAIGTNVDLLIKEAQSSQKWWYIGAAKAIRAWSWQTTTDYHGEIILKEAWEPNRFVFDYDNQEDVYAEVRRVAAEAMEYLDKEDATNTFSLGDIVYKGDRNKWKKFVNAILARNAHHISNKSTYDADLVIQLVDQSFTGNADNFNVPHVATTSSDANFYGPLRANLGSFRQTSFVISLLNGSVLGGAADPRLPLMFTASPDGTFRGVNPTVGDPNNVVGNVQRIPNLWGTLGNTSTTGKYIFQDKADFPLITYAELQFIKAEAAFIKGNKTMALEAYKKGIEAHMDFALVSAVNKASYMASAAVAQSEGELTISDIMLQKYIALYGHGCLETWVDLMRHHYNSAIYTGFTLPSVFYTDNNGKPAYRVRPRYNSEYVWNRESLDKIGGTNVDYHTYEQWFSKPE